MSDAQRESHGPPKGVDASELWLALTALPTPHQVVDFPVKDPIFGKSIAQVAIVPLPPEDIMICRKLAGERARDMTGEKSTTVEAQSPAYYAIMSIEASVQILWRALRDPNDPTLRKPAIPAAQLLRKAPFTDDILALLMELYTRTCVKCGPIIATMTETEREAWLDALEEGGAGFPFVALSSEMKNELLTHLVALRRQYRTGSGSPGQPLDASTSDTSPTPPPEPPLTLPESEPPPSASLDEIVIPKSE